MKTAIKTTFGGVDILINNAGSGSEETIMAAADEKWRYYYVDGGWLKVVN
jgi:NADP-dependent 3-hydroxy acid dehydrogenase YdfG